MDSTQDITLTEANVSMDTIDTKALDNEKKITQLEHDIFMISKQLEEARDLLKDANHLNITLKGQVESLEVDKIEKSKLIETLEKSRSELLNERTQLQNNRVILQSQKDAFEVDASRLLNEKRRLLDELNAVKAECARERKEKCLLQVKVDEFQNEKNLIAYEKERWSREKEILVQGKQWCMSEISNREMRINEMRIEMMKLEGSVTREKFRMTEERDALTVKVNELTDSLAKKEQELTDLRERVRVLVEERSTTLNEMDSELRTSERLAELYKSSLQSANSEIAELKESESKMQEILQENEMSIVNLNAELDKMRADFEKEVSNRDATIKNLNEELSKANELLRLGSRGVHRSDDEIAALSPSAAAASNLLRSGISLTSIYAEHCRVVAELEKKTAENERIERYVTDLIQELQERAPRFKEQKEAYDNAQEEIKRLNLQNELLNEDWNKIKSEHDAIARELTFTKSELERYQHEHHVLSLQVRRLLFSIERTSDANQEPLDPNTEERLFTNICELQQANMKYVREVQELKEANAEAIRNAHNTENEALKTVLQSVEKELERVRDLHSKSELVIMELTAQRDNYKKLYEEGENVRTISPPGTEKSMVTSDIQHWKSRVDFLQEKLEFFMSDKQESDRVFNERIDQQIEQIFQLRTTNGKLESALEFQKQNQQLMIKNVDELHRELKKATDEVNKLTVRIQTLQSRNDDLTNQLLNQQQDISQLRVMNHTLEEQLQISRSNELRANGELKILRETNSNSERVALTLEGVETILKRVDTEKQSSIISQLQSAQIERDNLKTLLDNVNHQHGETINKLKATVNELKSERDNALFELKNLQENYAKVDSHLNILKEEYEKLSSESLTSKVADDDIDGYKKEIQQLKNKCFYQEKQIKELQDKSEELARAVESKENELQKMCALSGNMENLIQEQNDYAESERKRLQAVCAQYEESLNERKKLIEELRNQVASMELQLLEKGRAQEHAETRFHEAETKYQQKCNELESLKTSNRDAYDQLQEAVNILQTEFDNHKLDFANLANEKKLVDEHLATEKANGERLQQIINELNIEVAKLKSSLDIAEKEKLSLIANIEEYKQHDTANNEKIETLYDRIKELMDKVSCMQNVQLASADDVPNYLFDDAQQTERLSKIMGFLREQNSEETKKRMVAELDLARLKAQASIDQERIGSLEAELSQAKIMIQTGAQVAREKDELLVKINAFREAQERYSLLKVESDDLKVQFEALSKKSAALDAANKQLQRDKANADRANSLLNSTLEQRKKEIADLRERNEKAMALASKYSPEKYTALQGEFEEIKQKLVNKETEITLLKEQLEKALKDLQAKSAECEAKAAAQGENQKLRIIARTYRESANEKEKKIQALEAELEKVKSEYAAAIASKAEASTSWTSTTRNDSKAEALLREKVRELQEVKLKLEEAARAKTELAEKVAKLEVELGEAREKSMRLDMITTSLNTQREKSEKLAKLLKEKEDLIEELQQKVQELSALSVSVPSGVVDDLLAPTDQEFAQSQPAQPSRKRGHSGDDDSQEVSNRDIADKRSRIVESDPSLSLDVTITEIPSDAQALLDSDPVTTSASISEQHVDMEKEAQEMLDDQVEYEEYEGEDEEEDIGEEDEFTDEENFDDDDGDNGPPDENAEQYEEKNASDEVICLSGDEDEDVTENVADTSQSQQQLLASEPQQEELGSLSAFDTPLETSEANLEVPRDSPKMCDTNVEQEQD